MGEVLYDGQPLPADFRQRSKEQLRRIQMIYQIPDTALNPRQRIVDIIGRPLTFYLGLKGKAMRARVAELLEMIELDPATFMERQPRELSGGQKQRICIARALAADPQLIICDEVTSALDQLVAEGVLKLLNRIQQQLGVAYLFITHDVATVRAIADEVLVMQRGRVVDHGSRSAIFHATAPGLHRACCFPPNHKWTPTGSTACWPAAPPRIQTLRWKKSKESP